MEKTTMSVQELSAQMEISLPKQSTKQGYVTVQRLLAKETFGKKTIRSVKTSDAKLFLIKLQQEDE